MPPAGGVLSFDHLHNAQKGTMPKHTIPGYRIEAEIFSTGTWNDETFTREDLEEIAVNFKRLKPHLKPPLKFGHDEHQTLLGQSDGDPALGWVEQLRVVGDRLLATFVGVPEVVYEAIKSQRYRRVSAELYFNLRRNGQRLGKALKAVALLGADLPAVTNLEDLSAFLIDRPQHGLQVGDTRAYVSLLSGAGITPLNEEHQQMSDNTNMEHLEAELEELRAYKAGQESRREDDLRQRRHGAFGTARENALAFCEQQRDAGRLAPHFMERLMQEVDHQVQTFSEGSELKVSFGWVRDFVTACAPALPQGELAHSATGAFADPAEPDNPSDMLASLASAKMVEMNLTYGQAAEYVLKTNPALAQAYREYTLNPSKGE